MFSHNTILPREYRSVAKNLWANGGSWTRDLILTKDALYHWATSATRTYPQLLEKHERINKNWAENGAQTRDPQLGRLVLYRLSYFRELTTTSATVIFFMWEQMDSNHRRWKPADLQSAPFGRSGILPFLYFNVTLLEPLVGFEPTTPRLQITCSGQLS